MSNYDLLMEKYKDLSTLSNIRGVLVWDIETGKMPAKGVDHRSEQLALISKYTQKVWHSDKLGKLLNQVQSDDLTEIEQRQVDLIRRDHSVKTKLPQDLLPKLYAQSNKTNEIWKKAKRKDDFSIVEEEMEKLFELNREYATKLADIKGMNDPFDALIDERDEGMNGDLLSMYFKESKNFLQPFIRKHKSQFKNVKTKIGDISLSMSEKQELTKVVADLFNYPISGDDARGSIDEVEHPLTITCGPDDVRITMNFDNWQYLLSATTHELGHGIDSLGKPVEWRGTPLNTYKYPSMGECNSRYTENKIGNTQEFISYILPHLNHITGDKFSDISAEELYRYIIRINPGPLRTRADEVTYGMHIIIRFEIEKMLFNDRLTISELPQVWNDRYEQYLGVEVENNSKGVMQDLHWFSVYYGYFHGYFMGDLISSQYHHYMEAELGDWKEKLREGSLDQVIKWHTDRIYSKGAMLPPLELLEKTTGEPLNVHYFKDYLKSKYTV